MLHDNKTMVYLKLSYNNLQIEVSDLMVQTISTLRYNIEMEKKLEHFHLLKSKGKKTEFLSLTIFTRRYQIPHLRTLQLNLKYMVNLKE